MYCDECNTEVAQSIRICPKCGNRNFSKSITEKPRVKSTPYAKTSGLINSGKNSTATNPRPWVRLWARLFDIMLMIIFVAIVLMEFFPSYTNIDDTVLGYIILFSWIFGEAFCISKFETTLGKKLFKISLVHKSGKPINFSDALSRSGLVAWRGLALFLPIVYIVTGCIAYKNLMKNGTTTWDADGGYIVSHQKIGIERIIISICIVAIFIYLVILGSNAPQSDTYL
jgi:uncharacterized RDD family membrane protein YckC